MSVKTKRRSAKLPKIEPLWKGPEVDGITQSMIGQWLVCRERFKILYIDGWKPQDRFNSNIEYGNMFHLCEEISRKESRDDKDLLESVLGSPLQDPWRIKLNEYCQELVTKYPTQQEEIEKWYQVCKTQFPVYQEYWKGLKDTAKSIYQEKVFDVPYELPSGRMVKLKGKWDGVSSKRGRYAGIYLDEFKTKSNPDEQRLRQQLTFDLQTMFYLVSMSIGEFRNKKVKGVRYNIIRKPLSGGKGTIRPHKETKTRKAETKEEFYHRLKVDYLEAEPEYWFQRWEVEVTEADINKFRNTFLDACLEQICCWYDWVTVTGMLKETEGYNTPSTCMHYRTPYGIYNPLTEGGQGHELDYYLQTGSTAGLERMTTVFPELES